jgi:signal transduction histidine kinase
VTGAQSMSVAGWPDWLPTRPTRELRIVVGVGLTVLAWAALVIPSNLSSSPLITRLAGVGVGGAIAVSGMAIWERRPGNRIGPVLVIAGILWIVARLQGAPSVPVALAANVSNSVAQIAVLAAVLTFPTGRLPSPVIRGILAWALVATVASNLLVASSVEVLRLTGEPNPIYVPLDASLHRVLIGLSQLAAYGGAIAAMVWLVARWLRSSAPGRRSFMPILLAGVAIAVVVLACQLVIDAGGLSNDELIGLVTLQLLSFALLPAAIAASVLRSRMARAAVADLVVQLGATPSPARLREALASALGDATLRVVHWSEVQDRYVDDAGASTELPLPGSGPAVTVLERHGRPAAAIVHDPALLDDPGLVASVATAVRLAVENERLTDQVRSQLEEVRASRARIVEAADAERRRVERNLHDGAQQRLVALSLALRRARAQLPDNASPDAVSTLDEASEQLKAALAELRSLARGIHPAILTEAGLGPALRALARDSIVPATVEADLPDDLADPIGAAAYFVAAEALTNIAKYAGATQVHIHAMVDAGELHLTISDDGRGGADPAAGSGLRGLADRVSALGGRLDIRSPTGSGTWVEAHMPLELAPGPAA